MNTDHDLDHGRRRTLTAGGAMMAGLALANAPGAAFGQTVPAAPPAGTLPVQDIQRILRASGRVSGPVLHVSQLRRDLDNVTGPSDIPFKPAFAISNNFYFQSIGNGRVILNGELALVAEEIEAVIDRILSTGLVFQAFHQHFFNLDPQIWHVHLRGSGSPYGVARGLDYVVRATATPLPQTAPMNPSSTLDVPRLGRILGGETVIHEEGIVTVHLQRSEQITLGGIAIDPRLGVEHEIHFEPLPDPLRTSSRRQDRCRAHIRADGAGGRARHASHAPGRIRHPLPLQPGDRRGAAALLLAPARGRQSLLLRPGDTPGPAADDHQVHDGARFMTCASRGAGKTSPALQPR